MIHVLIETHSFSHKFVCFQALEVQNLEMNTQTRIRVTQIGVCGASKVRFFLPRRDYIN
jgi:hypothetical protein